MRRDKESSVAVFGGEALFWVFLFRDTIFFAIIPFELN